MADLEVSGTSPASKSMIAMRRIAASVTGIDDVGRISLGYKRWDEDDDWEMKVAKENRETQGFVSIWFGSYELNYNDADTYAINAELVVHVPKNHSSWLSDALDLAHELTSAWGDPDNWLAGEQRPGKVGYSLDRIDTMGSRGMAYFVFGQDSSGLEFTSPC